MATPMMPPMKCAGITTSTLAVRPKRLSAMRMGRFGTSRGIREVASPFARASVLPLPWLLLLAPSAPLPPRREEARRRRRNHCE